METTQKPEDAFYALTLEEFVNASQTQLEEVKVMLSLGEMWTQKRSDVSCNVSQVLARLSFYHRRLTGALLVLRSWSGTNASATTRQISQLLTTWSVGSVTLMEAIEAGVMCEFLTNAVDHLVPTLVYDVVAAYVD